MIDSHAHLQADAFARDLPAVLGRAARAGITRILVPGWDLASSRAAITLAGAAITLAGERPGAVEMTGSQDDLPQAPLLVAAAGIHPHAAGEVDEASWLALATVARDRAVVAIGETGLDYDRMHASGDAQLANLRRHIALALTLGKPLVLHCRSARGRRDAQDDLLRELEQAGIGGRASGAVFGTRPPAVLHSFSGPRHYAERALALGLALSFSGLVFRSGEASSGAVARRVTGDRLLVETDAPYLSPPGAPRRNEPEWVRVTAAWLGARRRSSPESLDRDLAASFERIFGPIKPG